MLQTDRRGANYLDSWVTLQGYLSLAMPELNRPASIFVPGPEYHLRKQNVCFRMRVIWARDGFKSKSS